MEAAPVAGAASNPVGSAAYERAVSQNPNYEFDKARQLNSAARGGAAQSPRRDPNGHEVALSNNPMHTLDNAARISRHTYDYAGGPLSRTQPEPSAAALDGDGYVANVGSVEGQQGPAIYSTPTQAHGQRLSARTQEYEVENQPHQLDGYGYVAGIDLARSAPPAPASESRPRSGSVYAGFLEVPRTAGSAPGKAPG